MKLTDSQRAAIEHRGSNLLVAASAGSGKTEVLARRCVSLIADPAQPCGVEQLLVVTFTRAAAAELRIRVARMLREEAEQTTNADLRRHLRRQELLVETADIGTIDAWCGRIVREHFAEAGVDVDFTVLGEQDAILLRRQQLDRLLDAVHRGGEPVADEARAWLARAAAPGDGFLRGLVERLNGFREHLINPQQWFERCRAACSTNRDVAAGPRAGRAEGILATALVEECRFQAEQLETLLAGALPDEAVSAVQPYCDQLANWQSQLVTSDKVSEVVAEIKAFKIAKPGRGVQESPEVTEIRKRWLEGRLQKQWSPDEIASIVQHAPAAAELASTLLRLEERYQEMLADAKRRLAAYEFGDVLRMTLDLLGSPTEGRRRQPTALARHLRERYEHILVDEYQDTSPVQVEILRLITREDAGWTNRFMVGDVKQSIYGFRQAEPRLFSELIEAFEAQREEGGVQYLSDNFRSHPAVLDALNRIFALLFDRALGGTPFAEDERLRAGREEIANSTLDGSPRVEVHVIEQDTRRGPSTTDDESEGVGVERIERETQLAAERILEMLNGCVQVPERRADGVLTLRPLRLADIVILLRSVKQNAGLVARVLRVNGIQCVAGGREALLGAVEVRDVCNVLDLLVNRRQDVPLAAYLRGPLVGLTPTELLRIRAAAEEWGGDFYDAVENYCRAMGQVAASRPARGPGGTIRPGQSPGATSRSARGPGATDTVIARKLVDAMAQLERWSVAAREEDVPTLLQRILRDGSLTLYAQALRGGEQRVALLRSLQNVAAAFDTGGQSVAEFTQYLEALAAEEIDPGAPAAGGEDVVRIMTIHGAKGLEFPVVFLLGAGAKFNEQSQREALMCDEDLGLGLKFNDYPARVTLTSAEHLVIKRSVARLELEEELRLVYVATTRARERLYIVGFSSPGAWDTFKTQYYNNRQPPLISRLSVRNRLEWILMATAAGGLHESTDGQPLIVRVELHDPDDIRVPEPGAGEEAAPAPTVELTPEDEAWIAEGWQLLTAPVDRTLAERPAVLSVSAAKELALRERAEDVPYVLDAPAAQLRPPAFATETAKADGRELGTACHRLLEFADFTRLRTSTDVQAQVDELVSAGKLTPRQAELVPTADVAWLGTTAEGTLLTRYASSVQREVPFVYALPVDESGEHVLVRGVIDCLVETPEGLVLLDYKTDAVRDEQDFEARVAGYNVQMQLYAQAAGAIFGRPVTRAVLAFLRARRMVDVPHDPNPKRERGREDQNPKRERGSPNPKRERGSTWRPA